MASEVERATSHEMQSYNGIIAVCCAQLGAQTFRPKLRSRTAVRFARLAPGCSGPDCAHGLWCANHVGVQTNTPALTLADTMLFRAETPYQPPAATHTQVHQVQDDLAVALQPLRLLAQSTPLNGLSLTSKQA